MENTITIDNETMKDVIKKAAAIVAGEMAKTLKAEVRAKFKGIESGHVTAIASAAVKGRKLTDVEKRIYLMAYFEFGEAVEEIAREHNRHKMTVINSIREAIESRSAWVEYHLKKGVQRGKVDTEKYNNAVKEFYCEM